jgi:hypothetical protein
MTSLKIPLAIIASGLLVIIGQTQPTLLAQETGTLPVDTHSLIKFSGVWLSGKFQDINNHFPVGKNHTLAFGKEGGNELSKKILASLRQDAVPGKGRLIDSIAPDDFRPEAASGKAYVMACSINYEHVDCVEIGGVYKVMGEVGFDLVVCDFTTRSVVVCLPGRVMYVDVSKSPTISDDQKKAILNKIYLEMVPQQFLKICKAHGPEIIGLDSAGVTDVKLFDEALAVLPDHLKDRYQSYFGNLAASNFYESTGMPLIPYSRGSEMVFCGMQENLVDATNSVINSEEGDGGQKFILKKSLYNVELTIPAFQTRVATKNEIGKVVQNCSYARITIKQGEAEIYSSQHDGSVQNMIPRGSSEKTPWLAYSDSLNEMFFNAGKKIKSSMSGKDKKQESPKLIINSADLKSMFIDCAPWTIVKK